MKMKLSLKPAYAFKDITEITPGFLASLGVRFLMLDLDNTVAAYCESAPSENVAIWATRMMDSGIGLFIISNSIRKIRVDSFAEKLGIGFIKGASKPSPNSLIKTMAASGYSPAESALAGDQIFTDTLAANRAGVTSIIVKPRRFSNPILAMRYGVEAPFRALCRNKMWDKDLIS